MTRQAEQPIRVNAQPIVTEKQLEAVLHGLLREFSPQDILTALANVMDEREL